MSRSKQPRELLEKESSTGGHNFPSDPKHSSRPLSYYGYILFSGTRSTLRFSLSIAASIILIDHHCAVGVLVRLLYYVALTVRPTSNNQSLTYNATVWAFPHEFL